MAKRAEIVGLYPENGWDYDLIESILKSRTSIKRYILALHDQDVDADGKPVKPHHHVYLDFGNTNWQYEDIAKWFNIPPNMVGKIKADPKDKHPIIGRYAVIRYYTHAACPEKHFYPISSFRTNIADIEDFYAKQQEAALNRTKTGRHDSELADFIERCSAGEILPYNYWKYIPSQLYSQNASQFKNAWKMYHDARIAKAMGNRDCQILWLYGERGAGKTTLGTRKNPLTDYLNELAPTEKAKHPDPLDVLGKIADEYDPDKQQLSLFD